MADFRFRYLRNEPKKYQHYHEGQGNTAVEAKNMADSIVVVSVCAVVLAQAGQRVQAGLATPVAAGASVNVSVVMQQTGQNDRAITLRNIDQSLIQNGKLDTAQARVTAFEAAFRDENGVGGYSIFDSLVVAR